MRRLISLSLLIAAMTVPNAAQMRPAGTSASASSRWFHLRVDGDDGQRVRINLPMSAVEKAVSLAPLDRIDHSRISCNGIEFDSEHFDAWRIAVESSRKGPAVFERDGERVAIRREKEWVVFERTDEWKDGAVVARIPEKLADVIFAARPIDRGALGAALASMTEGDLFTAEGDRNVVRAWVDTDPRAK